MRREGSHERVKQQVRPMKHFRKGFIPGKRVLLGANRFQWTGSATLRNPGFARCGWQKLAPMKRFVVATV